MDRNNRMPQQKPPSKPKKRKSRLPYILLLLSVVTVLQLIVIMMFIIFNNIDDRIDAAVQTALDRHFAEQSFTTDQTEQFEEEYEETDDNESASNALEAAAIITYESVSLVYTDVDADLTEIDNEKDNEDEYIVDYDNEEDENNYDEYIEYDSNENTDEYTEDISESEDIPFEIPQLHSDSPYFEAEIPPLFNPWNPIPYDFHLELANVDGHQVHAKAAPALRSMMQAAQNDGITLTIISAHRSNARQTTNFNNAVSQRMARGMSYEAARIDTARYIAVPGTSEHEAGLAVDFNWIDVRFDQTREFRWLVDNAAYFGFILRYAQDTEHITGISYEPWHFRYVGINHAKKIVELGITLEEYIALF